MVKLNTENFKLYYKPGMSGGRVKEIMLFETHFIKYLRPIYIYLIELFWRILKPNMEL